MVGTMGTKTVHTCVAVNKRTNKQWLKERWKSGYTYTHVVNHTRVALNRTLGHMGMNTVKNYAAVKKQLLKER
jgi:hypothetical protein